jgi:hypothetical protein
VALTTLATLLLELSLTRIFSVVFHYHFAFLAISIALFGLGAGGVFSYAVAKWRWALFSKLGALSAVNALVVLVSLIISLSIRDNAGFWPIAAVYFPSTLPFFFAGTIVSLAIAETIERVDRVYFFDMVGAGAGCLLLVPLLNAFGGPNTVLATAAFYAAAGAIWYSLAGKVGGRAVSVSLALGLLLLLGYNAKFRAIDVKYAKGRQLANEQLVKWNSFSRIAVSPDSATGSPVIHIDADASSNIASYDLDQLSENDRQALLNVGPGFVYQLRPGAKTLIIGPGGGFDVARALAGGSRDVTGVEINPIIANIVMRDRMASYSHNLYFRPEVRIEIEEGRSFIRRSGEKYQVLQATLVATWASTAAGAHALAENNLYTSDAFHDYLSHLTGDGLLSFTRWGLDPPQESLRLLSLARLALARLGERDPGKNIIVVRERVAGSEQRQAASDTVLIARRPFSASDLARVREIIRRGGFDAVYLPGEDIPNPFTELLRVRDIKRFERDYPYDISPVTDDQPFFFYNVRGRDLSSYFGHFLGSGLRGSSPNFGINMSVPVMFGLLAVSLVAVVVILALPPLLLREGLPHDGGMLTLLMFFVAIGAGYIMIEVALIQRFVLFLGHPTYALTVIIFSMLVASGCGSFFSRRVLGLSGGRLSAALVLVGASVVLLTLYSGAVTEAGVGWPAWLKVAATVLMVAPPAFIMGMPLPTGLRLLQMRHEPSVKWAWALNSAASVLGSAGAIFLAVHEGLRWTLLAGGGLYVAAALAPLVVRGEPDAPADSGDPAVAAS